jgi:hypothetical protein
VRSGWLGSFGLTLVSTRFATERQLTFALHGHLLTNVNVWSPDSRWVVCDVRGGDSVFDGTRIIRLCSAPHPNPTSSRSSFLSVTATASSGNSIGRRLPLPAMLAPGQTVQGSFFFRISPGPQRLTLHCRVDAVPHDLVIDLSPMAGMHLTTGAATAVRSGDSGARPNP